MNKGYEGIAAEMLKDCVFSGMELRQWKQLGRSYFVRVPYSREAIPTHAERIRLNEKFMIFAFYRVGKKGEEKILGYEVRPIIPPQLAIVGAGLFLRYSDGLSPGGHTKLKMGDQYWPLAIAEYENEDVMFTLG